MEQGGILRTTADPCGLIKRNGGNLQGLVVLQVEESLELGTSVFMVQEEKALNTFRS